ncbi:bifunctional 3'-5' exonuclease/DNA polymerase [Compostimonas suwonensis]|uniref:DNA-directed DNA polymerase n=1 Tax=Compostimonas suwonensis TaxID=1048394 RepID=A0A2M9BYZ6_9MICO|nr:bifunctional 3'-5' exonuclease/DNA polymerase [Compostimonas suwonensis]PJJ63311.1 DNA polymerase-1 [Compostimonas suwonensis]
MHIVVELRADEVRVSDYDDSGSRMSQATVTRAAFPELVRRREAEHPRWVWSDTSHWYPQLLDDGVIVERCHDLTLSRAILRNSELTADTPLARAEPDGWDERRFDDAPVERPDRGTTLFDLVAEPTHDDDPDAAVEFERQLQAVAASAEPARLRLLLAAESVGALIASEMRHAGLPWHVEVHDRVLTELLGPRVPPGRRPATMTRLLGEISEKLGVPDVNPDSPAELVKALRRGGIEVSSTRSWELKEISHPAIPPLLEYKKLSRLLTANGWSWMDTWVRDGRFHPEYVPGGVVTGRWAARGGGALQLPKQVRSAVVADAGWKLVVADAAQLEPRILTGMSSDTAMAKAGFGQDLYDGIVASGAVDDRAHAKIAMLGAMYGATTGESGRLLPGLTKAFPQALALVEAAARRGERGEIVTTRLGRSSPRPGPSWSEAQSAAYRPEAGEAEQKRARSRARDWGRFTRNFVVQGSAAEWALCWMAELRKRLAAMPASSAASAGAGAFARRAHLVFFLHDEVMVHAPAEQADAVARAVTESARTAGRLLFGDFPVDFPVTVAVVDDYGQAK